MKPERLRRYETEFAEIEGYCQPESAALWDFFFTTQEKLDVRGDLLEIGVWHGKTAVLNALYARPEDQLYLIDHDMKEGAELAVRRIRSSNNIFLKIRSADALRDPKLRDAPGSCRWIHVDGDHTGYSATQDLHTAAHLVSERGIICVDDFFNFRYPQVTAAVYRFLFDHPLEFRMLFCGATKCYIVRAGAYAAYEKEVRQSLPAHLELCGWKKQIYKTTYSSDMGCFAMWLGEHTKPIYGMDENPDFIPY
ncbi:MAG: class I SAM-dependent methyltransferase [Acidobacteriia bacterium]|nr:class I SAM-dependent methyltransferase [Terriglobia bacterium]